MIAAILILVSIIACIAYPALGISVVVIIIVACVAVSKSNEKTREKNRNLESEVLKDFKTDISKIVGDYTFLISKDHQKLAIKYNSANRVERPIIVNVDNLSECEVLQNGSTVSKGALDRALVGGIIGGGAGAIVGANTAKQVNVLDNVEIKLFTKNIHNPIIRIVVFNKNQPSANGNVIHQCDELITILKMIINEDKK